MAPALITNMAKALGNKVKHAVEINAVISANDGQAEAEIKTLLKLNVVKIPKIVANR